MRVFISSTFKDMHGERDLLTRYVFPELRSWCFNYCLNIHEVDLRWGVTQKNAESARLVLLSWEYGSGIFSCLSFFSFFKFFCLICRNMKLTFLQLQSRDQSEFLNIPLMFYKSIWRETRFFSLKTISCRR